MFAVGFGCGILLGWRAFAFEGVTYEFYIDEYLVIDNKVYQDIRVGAGWVALVASILANPAAPPDPGRPAPTRGISFETAVDPSDPAAPTRGRRIVLADALF